MSPENAPPPRPPGGRFAALLRSELSDLSSYVPHAGRFDVRLDANEAPALLSDEARARIDAALAPADYGRYPDATHAELRAALAARVGARPEEILVGIGSDEIIALLLTALDRPRSGAPATTVVTTAPTFVMYKISARARGMKVVEVPLDDRWDLAEASMLRAIELARPNLVFVATPNNPTGGLVSRDRLERVIAAARDAVVVVDEAYVDFAPRSQLDLKDRYDNVVVLRTLSKIGFAALRVGWLVGPEELVREVDKTRQPYNLPTPTQRAATVVVRDLADEVRRVVGAIVGERERLAAALVALGLDVPPSHANFLWAGTPGPAGPVFEALAARGVLVRSFHATGGRLGNRLRITVGTAAQNDRLLEELPRCL